MMDENKLSVVTGAFGYTGKYIARRLLDQGSRVRTLTRTPVSRSPFGDQVEVHPLDFADQAGLVRGLEGAGTLYNTYWIRFARGRLTHETAVENLRVLFRAAREAGVRRVVHISITNASEYSLLSYFRGKALAERALRESGLSYGIVRPALLFSNEDILANNIAWFLRRFPVFPIAGSGRYLVQPVSVEDVARLAVEAGAGNEDTAIDAVGPETFAFEEFVRVIARRVGSRSRILRVSPAAALLAAGIVGLLVRDIVLSRWEIDGLMANLLVSEGPPTAPTRFTEWLEAEGASLGQRYASELARHYR